MPFPAAVVLARMAATSVAKSAAKSKGRKVAIKGLKKAHSVAKQVDNNKRKSPKSKPQPRQRQSTGSRTTSNLPAIPARSRGSNLPAVASYGVNISGLSIVESTAKIGELVTNAGTLNSNPDLETAQGRKEQVQQHAFQNQVIGLLEQIAINSAKDAEIPNAPEEHRPEPEPEQRSFVGRGVDVVKEVYQQSEKGSLLGFALAALMPTVMEIASMWNNGTLFDFISDAIGSALATVTDAISGYFNSGEFIQDVTGILDSVIGKFGDWVTEAQRGIQDKFLDLEEGFFSKVDDMFIAGGKLMNRIQETLADWWNDKVDFIGTNGTVSIPKIEVLGKTLFDGFNFDLKIDTNGLRAGNRAEESMAVDAKMVRQESYDIERAKNIEVRAQEDKDTAEYREGVNAGKSNKVQDAYYSAKSSTLGLVDNIFGTDFGKDKIVPNGTVNLKAKGSAFRVASHVNTNGLNPELKSKLYGFGEEYQQIFGEKINITSGYRSPAYQKKLFNEAVEKYGSEEKARKWVAKPGKSMHNYGFAVDMNKHQMNKADRKGLLQKYGLHRPVSHEAWHVELKGINRKRIREEGQSKATTSKIKDLGRGPKEETERTEAEVIEGKQKEVKESPINKVTTEASVMKSSKEITKPKNEQKRDDASMAQLTQIANEIGAINSKVASISATKGTMQSETIRKYS